MPLRPLLAGLLAALSLLAVAPAAQAHGDLLSLMQDDDLLVYRDDATRLRTLEQMKALGADGVRVTVLWEVVALDARSTPQRRRRFNRAGPQSPRAYPRLGWDRYDRIVRDAQRLGMVVLFCVTGPGPAFAHEKAPKRYAQHQRTWRPKPRAFYDFVRAVGTRYSGRYRDENEGRSAIPRVSFWSLWNEPNQGGWLTPQNLGGRMVSADAYRALYDHGVRALQRTGHGSDTILMGETAPTGVRRKTVTSAVAPKTFIRRLFCVGRDGRPRRGKGCSVFNRAGALPFSGWAHHPYTKNVSPVQRPRSAQDVTMANISELPALLDQIAERSGRVEPGRPVLATEFGFESNPPDVRFGVPAGTQAAWNAQGDFLAARNPRVTAITQFLLRDAAPNRRVRKTDRRYWLTYQSGLLTRGGTPKPAALAYAFPFHAAGGPQPDGTRVVGFWGMLRFRPNALATPDQVALQWRPPGGAWQTVGDPIVVGNAKGIFEGLRTVPGAGEVRAAFVADGVPTNPTTLPQQVP